MRPLIPTLIATLGAVVSPLTAQITPDAVLVATRVSGNPAARLLQVDVQTGAFVTLGRFPSDTFPPLAVAIDPIDRDVLLAVDVAGVSRLLRLRVASGAFVSELALADLPGLCTQLTVAVAGDVYATIDGPNGGVVQVPRNGGVPFTVRAAPYASALATYPGPGVQAAILAQSGSVTPPTADPQLAMIDLSSGQVVWGPFVFTGYQPAQITGVVDLPTGVPRQLVSHDDGTIALYTGFMPGNPVPLQVTPVLPAGATVAMHDDGASFQPLVLGGSAHPFLKTFSALPLGGPTTWQMLAGPLPGDPVDFARAPLTSAQILPFGIACGTARPLRIWHGAGGPPRVGNMAFSLKLTDGVASSAALLALGFSDEIAAGQPLPLTLPNGCLLLVSPDHVLFQLTGAGGVAEQPLPVPNLPALIGWTLFAQWFQAPALPFATSEGAAVQIGA